MRFLKIVAAFAALFSLAACTAGASLQTRDDPETGVHYVSFTGAMDKAGGPRMSVAQSWQVTGYDNWGHPIWGLKSDHAGSGYGTGQTATGAAIQALGVAASGALGGLLTRPSNISVTQGGAVAAAQGGSARSGSFSQGGNAVVTNNNSAASSSSSSSSSAAAACGSFYGC